MNEKRQKLRSALGWVAMAATVIGVGVYDASQNARRQSLRKEIVELRAENARLKAERNQDGEWSLQVRGIDNQSRDYDREMALMLRRCASREDFLVREGPRIVWSELSESTERSKRMGIYLPAGRHWLKYAVADSGRLGGNETAQFLRGDPRELSDVVSLELGPVPEVYQFDLRVTDDDLSQIEVVGRDNRRVHEETVPLKTRRGVLTAKVIKEGFAFPSEFKPTDEDRPYFLKPVAPPITDLAMLSVPVHSTGGVAMIRLWVESNAPACMPALHVAATYEKVTSLRYRHDNPATIERVTDPDTEFARLFEPYDGSGRFIFREEIFLRPHGSGALERDRGISKSH